MKVRKLVFSALLLAIALGSTSAALCAITASSTPVLRADDSGPIPPIEPSLPMRPAPRSFA